MAHVYIVNDAGHDYSDAEQYGEVRALTVGDVNPLKIDRLAYHLARGIGKFVESKEDYLLISGTPILNALALTLWLKRFPQARVLQWNAKAREYEITTLTNEQLDRVLSNHMMT